ncbi:response regulator transcription factor [[Empedobacter] haloabium]|uniref:Response regulator transcription factor n=1 Tax=[Empedobacter] haloabium TaxID=592317 RepID=A0ABZ1UGH6_9BURK
MQILLVDDHDLFREGLKLMLDNLGPEVRFAEAGTVAEALALLRQQAPDLVLADLYMPDADGLDVLTSLREVAGPVPVVVLSSEDDPRAVRSAIGLGARGYVPKSSTGQVLLAAVGLVLAGGTYLPPNVLHENGVPGGWARPLRGGASTAPRLVPAPAPADGLSSRQREVLLKVVQGKANKVIARELQLSEGTVKAHLSAAFRALGVRNRTQAVSVVAKVGLTSAEGGSASVDPAFG